MSTEVPTCFNPSGLACPLKLSRGYEYIAVAELPMEHANFLHVSLENTNTYHGSGPELFLKRVFINERGRPKCVSQIYLPSESVVLSRLAQALQDVASVRLAPDPDPGLISEETVQQERAGWRVRRTWEAYKDTITLEAIWWSRGAPVPKKNARVNVVNSTPAIRWVAESMEALGTVRQCTLGSHPEQYVSR